MRKLKDATNVVLLLFTIFLAIGCETKVSNNVRKTDAFFDLAGLLDRQLFLLDSLQPVVRKITEIDSSIDTVVQHLDSAGWAREMEIFYEADINKPVLRDAYLKEEYAKDGLRTISYEAIDGENAEISSLKLHYREGEDNPMQITAVFKEKNILYDANRFMKLSFNNENQPPVLAGYSIEGVQKMLLKDSVFYRVELQNEF